MSARILVCKFAVFTCFSFFFFTGDSHGSLARSLSRPLLEQTHKPSYSVLGAGTRDQPLRKSAWEATIVSATPRNNSLAVRKTVAEPLL